MRQSLSYRCLLRNSSDSPRTNGWVSSQQIQQQPKIYMIYASLSGTFVSKKLSLSEQISTLSKTCRPRLATLLHAILEFGGSWRHFLCYIVVHPASTTIFLCDN